MDSRAGNAAASVSLTPARAKDNMSRDSGDPWRGHFPQRLRAPSPKALLEDKGTMMNHRTPMACVAAGILYLAAGCDSL
jgi:hypothetical protein